MLRLQDTFNSVTTENWKQKNLDWALYSLAETGEAIDSLDFKHWKHQEENTQNYVVELIDIWHFVMSLGQTTWSDEYLADKYERLLFNSIVLDHKHLTIKKFAFALLGFDLTKEEDFYDQAIIQLGLLLKEQSFDINSLYRTYLVKNCLNKFRQDNGYKQGTYKKLWILEGKEVEDNVVAWHLSDFKDTFDTLTAKLAEHYAL